MQEAKKRGRTPLPTEIRKHKINISIDYDLLLYLESHGQRSPVINRAVRELMEREKDGAKSKGA